MQHLRKHHHVDDEGVRIAIANSRVGQNGQSRFWCGFCREIIPLRSQGREAWNERFDHIDLEHFRRGQRIGDWLHCCHSTEDQEREESKGRSMAGGNEDDCDHPENGNDGYIDCLSDTALADDVVAVDQETSQQMVSCEINSLSKRASGLEDSSEPGNSRKRKFDTFGLMVAPYRFNGDDGFKSKRRISTGIPLPQPGSSQMACHVKFDN